MTKLKPPVQCLIITLYISWSSGAQFLQALYVVQCKEWTAHTMSGCYCFFPTGLHTDPGQPSYCSWLELCRNCSHERPFRKGLSAQHTKTSLILMYFQTAPVVKDANVHTFAAVIPTSQT